MFTRDEAWDILCENLKNKNLRKHCLASEAVMRKLAKRLGEDEEIWGMAGLMHDIDYERCGEGMEEHGLLGGQMLEYMGMSKEIVNAVKAHNEFHKLERKTKLDKALYSVDPLTGLIVAAALINPEKKLSAIDTEFVLNRFNEKSFARGANREQIEACSELGMELDEFIGLGLEAMQEIDKELGL